MSDTTDMRCSDCPCRFGHHGSSQMDPTAYAAAHNFCSDHYNYAQIGMVRDAIEQYLKVLHERTTT